MKKIIFTILVLISTSCEYKIEQEIGRFRKNQLWTYVWKSYHGNFKIIEAYCDYVTIETVDSISCSRYKQAELFIQMDKQLKPMKPRKIKKHCK